MSLTRGGEMSEALGYRISKMHHQRGMTPRDLAIKIGVTEASMCRYIRGERIPKAHTLANIAKALNTTADNLLGLKLEEKQTITCFKCHGAGVYGVPYLDDNGEWDGRLDVRKCEVCGHTGKITLALYEKWQKRMREDKK